MNNTNRAANRTLVLITGLVLLALGATAIAVATVPAFASIFTDAARGVRASISSLLVATPLANPLIAPADGSSAEVHSWLWMALIAALAVVVVLLLMFIFRQGHGHTRRLVARDGSAGSGSSSDAPVVAGGVTIDSAVAEQSLAAALAERPEIVSSRVSTYLVRKEPVLKIAATARRGVSPRELSETIERLVRSFDAALGEEIPVVVQISGGFRTRLSQSTRLQ